MNKLAVLLLVMVLLTACSVKEDSYLSEEALHLQGAVEEVQINPNERAVCKKTGCIDLELEDQLLQNTQIERIRLQILLRLETESEDANLDWFQVLKGTRYDKEVDLVVRVNQHVPCPVDFVPIKGEMEECGTRHVETEGYITYEINGDVAHFVDSGLRERTP